jgi:recombination protein RecR
MSILYKNEKLSEIENLIKIFSKLPGLGPRSARRLVFHLIKKREILLGQLISSITKVEENVKNCAICGNIALEINCEICNDNKRDRSIICVVEEVSDLWAMDRSGVFNGVFHVLGGLLSPLDGIGPDKLRIDNLKERIINQGTKELVLALGATVTGQTTASYLLQELSGFNISITSLAQGVPVGGELDYLDDSTIVAAFNARKSFL